MPPATSSNNEEAAYAAVLAELRNGVRDEPLMAKAYAEAEGEENKARALYMRWRSAKLMDTVARERRQAFNEAARAAPPPIVPRRRYRSWSKPRSYDFLLVILALVLLFLFNGDVHRLVIQLLHRVGWHLDWHPG